MTSLSAPIQQRLYKQSPLLTMTRAFDSLNQWVPGWDLVGAQVFEAFSPTRHETRRSHPREREGDARVLSKRAAVHNDFRTHDSGRRRKVSTRSRREPQALARTPNWIRHSPAISSTSSSSFRCGLRPQACRSTLHSICRLRPMQPCAFPVHGPHSRGSLLRGRAHHTR
jgi:hypothetical protein